MDHPTEYAKLESVKRAAEALFSRNFLYTLLAVALLFVSGFATWRGLTDFIVGLQGAPKSSSDRVVSGDVAPTANNLEESLDGLHKPAGMQATSGAEGGNLGFGGELQDAAPTGIGANIESILSARILIALVVIVLTLVMWVMLRETIRPRRPWNLLFSVPLYSLLFLWSVGFGYGFWWSQIAAPSATTKLLKSKVDGILDEYKGTTRAHLEQLQDLLKSTKDYSDTQLKEEAMHGGSCGIDSPPGKGTLYDSRNLISLRIKELIRRIQFGAGKTEEDVQALESIFGSALQQSLLNSDEENQLLFENLSREAEQASDRMRRHTTLRKGIVAPLNNTAMDLSYRPGATNFYCYDPLLAEKLRELGELLSQEMKFEPQPFESRLGPEGVSFAVMELWSTAWDMALAAEQFAGNQVAAGFRHLTAGRPENAELSANGNFASFMELEDSQGMNSVSKGEKSPGKTAFDKVELTGRDTVALIAALAVDLSLLVFTVLNPPARPLPFAASQGGLVGAHDRILRPSRRVAKEIAEVIDMALGSAPRLSRKFLKNHFVMINGRIFFIVPDLERCNGSKGEGVRAIALNHTAGVFNEMGLTRPLDSSDLSDGKENTISRIVGGSPSGTTGKAAKNSAGHEEGHTHGPVVTLEPQFRGALETCGWSESACRYPKVFVLREQPRSFIPLLTVLFEGETDGTTRPTVLGNEATKNRRTKKRDFLDYLRERLPIGGGEQERAGTEAALTTASSGESGDIPLSEDSSRAAGVTSTEPRKDISELFTNRHRPGHVSDGPRHPKNEAERKVASTIEPQTEIFDGGDVEARIDTIAETPIAESLAPSNSGVPQHSMGSTTDGPEMNHEYPTLDTGKALGPNSLGVSEQTDDVGAEGPVAAAADLYDSKEGRNTIETLVACADDLQRAQRHANDDDSGKGLAHLRCKIQSTLLKDCGVETFGECGDDADPNFYEHLSGHPSDRPKREVLDVVYSGYRRKDNGRLIRPANVVVSNGAGDEPSAKDI